MFANNASEWTAMTNQAAVVLPTGDLGAADTCPAALPTGDLGAADR